jgi:hypothetical protein
MSTAAPSHTEKSLDDKSQDEDYLSDTSEGSWKPSTGTHPSVNLPLAFKIYISKALTITDFYIAREKGQRLHAITGQAQRLTKSGETILHQGPDADSPAFGNATIDDKEIKVNLPSGTHVLHELNASFWQKLKSSGTEFYFDFPVNGSAATERFEWRRSKGEEVKSLQGRGKNGWILSRVGHGAEPVAVYAVDAASMKLSGHFAFLNSGATSELGADFAVTAVLSALSLGYLRRQAYVTGSVLINSKGD